MNPMRHFRAGVSKCLAFFCNLRERFLQQCRCVFSSESGTTEVLIDLGNKIYLQVEFISYES